MKAYGQYKNRVPVFAIPIRGNGKLLEKVQGAVFNTKEAICYLPAFYPFLPTVYSDLITIAPNIEFNSNAIDIVKREKYAHVNYYKKGLLEKSDFEFVHKPHNHQMKSLLHCVYHLRAGLLLDCGLGKTFVMVNMLRYLREKALVICPPSLIPNWEAEIELFSEPGELKVVVLAGTKEKKCKQLQNKIDADIVLVGYKTAQLYQEEIFNQYQYDIAVCDESQRVKSFKSAQTKAALFLGAKAYRRVIMSGTAVLNSPVDLYSQLRFLTPALVGTNYYHFLKRYVEYSPHNKHIVVGYKNMDALNKRVNSVSVRFKKEDCLDLPKRLEINKYCALSPEQDKLYKELLSDEVVELKEGSIDKKHKLVILGKLSQVTGGFLNVSQKDSGLCDKCLRMELCVENKIKPYTKQCAVVKKAPLNKVHTFKRNAKLELLETLIDSILMTDKPKIIIWAHYVWEIERINKLLEDLSIPYLTLPSDAKKVVPAVDDFNKSNKLVVLTAQISRGVGYTANSANYVIYYSLDFSLENYQQSIDRNYRIGQLRDVIMYRLLVSDTLDTHKVKALEAKQDVQETLLANFRCLNCVQSMYCLAKRIQPWTKGCKYKTKFSKTTLKIGV